MANSRTNHEQDSESFEVFQNNNSDTSNAVASNNVPDDSYYRDVDEMILVTSTSSRGGEAASTLAGANSNPEPPVQDEERGTMMETSKKTFEDSTVVGNDDDEASDDNQWTNAPGQHWRRCWIVTGIVLVALVASTASATATAIGMAVGMSRLQNESPSANAVSTTTSGTTSEGNDLDEDTNTTPIHCAVVRCGTSWEDANSKCGKQCLTEVCPDGLACWADLDPSLDCCTESVESHAPLFDLPELATEQQPMECTTTRCGLAWPNANNYCLPNCRTDDDCDGETRCFADLTTDLDCCSNANDTDNATETTTDESASTCTMTRCGSSWVDANDNCYENCLSNADCTEPGYTCFADLNAELDCCLNGNQGAEEDAVPYEGELLCSAVRCGVSWGEANDNCYPDCTDNSDCTEPGHTCFADLTTELDCCQVRA